MKWHRKLRLSLAMGPRALDWKRNFSFHQLSDRLGRVHSTACRSKSDWISAIWNVAITELLHRSFDGNEKNHKIRQWDEINRIITRLLMVKNAQANHRYYRQSNHQPKKKHTNQHRQTLASRLKKTFDLLLENEDSKNSIIKKTLLRLFIGDFQITFRFAILKCFSFAMMMLAKS